MRAPDLAGRAGGAGRDRDALEVEPDQRRLGADARDRESEGVRKPRRLRPEHHRVAWIGGKTGLDCENKGPGTGGKPVAVAPGKLGRKPEADDPGDVLGAGPVAALLPAAADETIADLDPVRGQHDRADALGAAELVRRQRQNIRP